MNRRWIPVSESLPTIHDLVLVCLWPAHLCLGRHDGVAWGTTEALGSKVTHWRHLPLPPKQPGYSDFHANGYKTED